MIDWWFRNRRTGPITVAQIPNAALSVFLVVTVLRSVLAPSGRFGTAVGALATGALVVWAADEVVRGVNPWRRLLGAAVLAGRAMAVVGR